MSKDYVRGINVSPGVYTNEVELSLSNPSLGITTLGLVGETVKGPAFEPIAIEDWSQFQNYFGGTNPEKFKGTQYPKYELPYIAKSYLTESSQLYVTRVLGFSGYNAGPAWIISAKYSLDYLNELLSERSGITINEQTYEDSYLSNNTQYPEMVVAIIRSRGYYEEVGKTATTDECDVPVYTYDQLYYHVSIVENLGLSAYMNADMNYAGCDPETNLTEGVFDVNQNNYGRFTISGNTNTEANMTNDPDGYVFNYPVSLNPYDKDYILNVLGTKQDDGDAPIYVEELYDVALQQMINEGKVVSISKTLGGAQDVKINNRLVGAPVDDILTRPEDNGPSGLNRSLLGKRYLAGKEAKEAQITYHKFDNNGQLEVCSDANSGVSGTSLFHVQVGSIYEVKQYTEASGKRVYWYVDTNEKIKYPTSTQTDDDEGGVFVKVNSYDKYFCLNQDSTKAEGLDVVPVGCDFNNYKSMYTHAVSPWIVSEIKGDAIKMELVKLFRFHSITDGKFANQQVKISILNIRPDAGTFDVAIRDFNDSDTSPVVLESYTRCNLIPGDSNYLGYRIGTFDGIYETKSLYVTVEINETDKVQASVPAGFMGYPVRNYKGMRPDGKDFNYDAPVLRYNTTWDQEIKNNRQYFGMSDLVGIDVDVLNYKGVDAYDNESDVDGYTPGFHLDSRLNDVIGKYKKIDDWKDASKLSAITVYTNDSTNPETTLDKYKLPVNAESCTVYGYIEASTVHEVDDTAPSDGTISIRVNFTKETGVTETASAKTFSYAYQKPLNITVDGQSGYTWETVSEDNVLPNGDVEPKIGLEADMEGSIYEYVNLRKFTFCLYGGFDGWDIYRTSRTNTDAYKMSTYKGSYDKSTGDGTNFSRLADPAALNLDEQGLTTDYYAYLSGIRSFANKDTLRINLFATPGIDYVNNLSLVEEAIDMIQDERQDSLYVVTTPDKPAGASDDVNDMYTPDDAVANLEYSEITSSYVSTYYPWVKYLDSVNNQYIYLPTTKDVVRNMAMTDNSSYPWFPPAGLDRGDVDCVRARRVLKIGEENTLTEAHINPVKTFAVDGVKIWGNRNLLPGDYISSQVSVRRLMIRIRQLIVDASLQLIFEPNDPTVRMQFTSMVTPILDNVRSNRGISDYRIKVDNSTEALDSRDLTAVIYVKPYNALEYVNITFVITPQGLAFEDII